MAKKKTAKKAKVSKKTRSENRGILSFLIVPAVIILAAIGLTAFFVVSTQVSPVNNRHQEVLVETVASQYEGYINNVLKYQADTIEQIAVSPVIIQQILNRDTEKLAETEQLLSEQIPHGLGVHIFAVRSAQQRPNSSPPLSHSGLDMIRRAEQGQNLSVEAHQFDGKAYLNSAKAIRSDTGRLIGTVTIMQSLDYLTEALDGLGRSQGNLTIQQRFEGAPIQTLVTYGAKNNNQTVKLNTANPNWTFTFQPAEELVDSSILTIQPLWIAFGVLAIISIVSIVFAAQQLQATLRRDANGFAKQVQALLSGKKTANADFEFAIFATLAKTINRMRMGKLGTMPAATTTTSVSLDDIGLPQAPMAEDAGDLNVPMMDSDNDLLGMTQPTASQTVAIVDESLFRTDDIHGQYGSVLSNDIAVQVGLAIGSEAYDRGEQTIIVGRDGRLSSSELSQALIRGLNSSGRDVVDIGVVTTPMTYFGCEHLNIGSCVMVTGGDSPSDFNGFKVVLGSNALLADEIKGLYHRIENQNFLSGSGSTSGKDISSEYITRICQDIQVKRPLKVVIDCGNGVAGKFVSQLIKGVGCHVLPLFCDVDGNFPNHLPEPTDPKNLQDLTRTVVETRADLGLAFDGDGNRLVLVTNGGQVIKADKMLMLLAKQVLQNNPGATIIYDVKSSRRLKNQIVGFGGKPVMWAVGQSVIKYKMKETGAALAGEIDGHIYYKDRWYGFDDGLYAAARLLETIASQNETSETIFADMPQDVSTPELPISIPDERKQRVIESLQRNGQFPGGQKSDVDGIRVDFPDGWGLVRSVDSEPLLMCRFEGDNPQAMQTIQNLFKQQLLAVDSQLQIPF